MSEIIPFDLLDQLSDLINTDRPSADMLKSVYDTGVSSGSASVDLADGILGGSAAGNSKYYGTSSVGTLGFNALPSGGGDKYPFEARLTLESGVPLSLSAQTAKTTLYLTPFNGDQIALFDGVSVWSNLTLFADIAIKSTDAQQGTTTNGNKIIAGLTDTGQFVAGMKISGAGVGVGSVISTIDSPTQVTGTVNSTASATVTVTFKLPASTVYDVFAFNNSGAIKLEFLAGVTTRSIQNGIDVKTGSTTRRLVGTISTTAIDGQMEISPTFLGVSNRYNTLLWSLFKCPGYVDDALSTSYTMNSVTWIEATGVAGAGLVYFVLCKAQAISFTGVVGCIPALTQNVMLGVGIDTIINPFSQAISQNGPLFQTIPTTCNNKGLPLAAGSHYASLLLAYATTAGNATIYADYGGVRAGASNDPAATFLTGSVLF